MEKHDRALVSGMVIAILEIWMAWLIFIVLAETMNPSVALWNAYGMSAIATVMLTMLATLFLYMDHSTSWEEEVRDKARDTARVIVEKEHREAVRNEVESLITNKVFEKVVRKELDEAVEMAIRRKKLP